MVGYTVGRYRVVEELGAGAMGTVYRATDERLRRDVAIKVLRSRSLENTEVRARFRHEALALSRINHPNIAGIHDFDTVDGLDMLVMEFVPGMTLADRIAEQRGPLSEGDVLHYGRQLLEGLAAAHGAGIVHRDLKPANVRVTPDGWLKILDFGLAKESDPSSRESTVLATAEGQIAGTLPYMAPEQVRGEPADVRTDLHAVGTVLYEMTTGRRPYVAASAVQLADVIVNRSPVPPRLVYASLSPALEQMILRLLEKDPGLRYQSAHAALRALEGVTRPVLPSTEVGSEAVSRAAPRVHRRSQIALAVAALTGMTLVGVNWWNDAAPALAFEARDWILVTNVENTTGDPLFDRSLDAALRVGLEQSMYANVFSQTRVTEVLARMGKASLPAIDVAVGREICQRESIRALVAVSISQVGRQYALAARLIDPSTGDSVRSYAETAATKDDVLSALDRVARDLRHDLGESLAAIEHTTMPLPRVTTGSLEALKAYAEARVVQSKGQEREAARLFTRAIELDPEFALAHAGVGASYSSFVFNEESRGREHLERAMALRQRVSERERSIIELGYHATLGHTKEAIELYRLYLRKWPDDVALRYNFATLLRNVNQLDEAIDQFREAIRVAPSLAGAHVNLATSYHLKGLAREALASWEQAFEIEPAWVKNSNLNHEYGATLVANGYIARARQVFDSAIQDKSLHAAGLRSAALLDMYEGRYRSAQRRLQEAILVTKATRSALSEARNHLFLAILFTGRGDLISAVRELNAAAVLRDPRNPQVWLWGRIGALAARLGAVPMARAMLQRVRSEAADNEKDQAVVSWLEGEIALASGQRMAALEMIQVAEKMAHSPLTQEALARAYLSNGDRTRAIETYVVHTRRLTAESLLWEPMAFALAAKLELARLYEASGQPEKAQSQLDELLTLWRDADADLPLVRDAEALLARLDSSRSLRMAQ